jgi:hypothetical protein
MRFKPIALLIALGLAVPAAAEDLGLSGEEAERFLKDAKVLELRYFKTKGVTQPRRAVLSDGERTARASFKIVDETKQQANLGHGQVVMNFRDYYGHEIAAYQLSKMLGSDLVPPCIQRRIRGDVGALCLWVEDTTTEWDRLSEDIEPPDPADWANQMATVDLFLQLIDDIDFRNVANLLVDEDFTIHKIDSSRAFRTDPELPRPERLRRFSRTMLEALRGLDEDEVKANLKKWLTKYQINGLTARRDALLELADKRIAEKGEVSVLFP